MMPMIEITTNSSISVNAALFADLSRRSGFAQGEALPAPNGVEVVKVEILATVCRRCVR